MTAEKLQKQKEKNVELTTKEHEAAAQAVLDAYELGEALQIVSDQGQMFIDNFSSGLSENLVGALFDVKTATVDFGEIFKQTMISMTAQLGALLVKFAIFKAITSALSLTPGGIGAQFLTGLTGFTAAANGFDGDVNKPTAFLAGEAGPERVTVTPKGEKNKSASGGVNINFNGPVYGSDDFDDRVNLAMENIERNYN